MKGPPTGFWAKLDQDPSGRVVSWHSVADHCADVAACFHVLLEQPVIRARLAAVSGLVQLTDVQAARLTVLAALHDIGKFNHGFQSKSRSRRRFGPGHVRELLALFGNSAAAADGAAVAKAVSLDAMRSWAEDGDTIEQLLITAISHHGKPVALGVGYRHDIWLPSGGLDPFEGIADLANRIRHWIPRAFVEAGEPLPATTGLQHIFNGILTLADWLGSDTRFFPFEGHVEGERFVWAIKRAREAACEIGLDTSTARSGHNRTQGAFSTISERTPYPMQELISSLPAESSGGVMILEAETGSGKTEAALGHFVTLFRAGVVDGLYFALPTRTAATQIHRRVSAAVARAFPHSPPPVVLAVPGYLAVDDRIGKRRLPGFEVLWPDDDRERWRFRGWAAERPKRYLAGAIVVGTIDQVLLSTLTVPHAHLRAASLLRHLLVVDEVHASDAYMTRILEDVLARHLRAGGHALLMSATLGAASRDRLLNAGQRAPIAPLEEACAVAYPLVSRRVRGQASERIPLASSGRSRGVTIHLEAWMSDPASIAERALDATRKGACVLVVRNTVNDCIATQESLEAITAPNESGLLFGVGGIAAPHHSRFAREDRKALDGALEKRFGKHRGTGGCVAIATQTVQQSLDLDADLLISDLCPMDVLLQRIGRLHRHERGRAKGFEFPVVEVLVPEHRDLGGLLRENGHARGQHGMGTVYENLTPLEATWRQLLRFPEIAIPEMNRELVERATHEEALGAIESELGEAWIKHGRTIRGVYRAHQRLADLNLVNWSAAFAECLFPSGELSRKIPTRLGQDDRLVSFGARYASPFGKSVEEMTLPAHLVRHADAEAVPLDIEAEDGYIRFTFGAGNYLYDRLGLRLMDAQESDNTDA